MCRAFLEHYCDYLPLDSERKVEKLLHACDKRQLAKPGKWLSYQHIDVYQESLTLLM